MDSSSNFAVSSDPVDQCKLVECIVKSNQRGGSYGSAIKCMKGWREDSGDEEYGSVKYKKQRDSGYVFKPKTPYGKSLSRKSTFYCSDCERYFQSRFNYTQHVKFDIKHQKSNIRRLITPESETSYPSKFIESTYQYQGQAAPMTPPHSPYELTKEEEEEEEESSVTAMLNNYIIPDRNDPNNYCYSCDYAFYSKALFHFHLNNFHSIATTKPANCPFN